MRPYRTLLEQKIRERRMTLEEFCTYAENFAREHGEPGTLSLRHLQRLAAGKGPKGQPLGPIRPATARLLERIFEMDGRELLAPPMQAIAPPSDDAADLRDRIQNARRVDAGILQGLRNQLNTIRRIDRQYGAIVTHSELLAKITETRDLFTYSLTGNKRRELAVLLSEMHALAGWQSLDMGHCSASWRHYDKAKQASLEMDDLSCYFHAAAEQAFTLIDLDDTGTAAELIDSTRRLAQRRCPELLCAWLCAAHGEALAAAGRNRESMTLFDRAERRLQRAEVNFERPFLVLDTNHLARWRGHAASRAGDIGALKLLNSALGALDSTFTRAESALRVDLATTLITVGEPEKAGEELCQARKMARGIGSERQLNRIRLLQGE